jgi:Restriction endonuclease
MRPDEFQDKLRLLTWADFEKFVTDVLRDTGRFRDVRQSVLVDSGMGYVREFDIAAIEVDSVGPIPPKWYFEVKKRDLTSIDVIDSLLGKYHDLPHTNGPIRLVLVTSGSLTQAAQRRAQSHGLEVWDSATLANLATPEVMECYFGEGTQPTEAPQQNNRKSDLFLQALGNTPPGREFWSAYQRLGSEIFEYLFCPPLEPPRYNVPDSDMRNVRDMICENSTMTGFWALMRAIYAAQYIVVDAKNYSDPIEKQPVLDIAHYLKSYGCGLFGILLTRKGSNEAADHAIREQWIGAQKMIVVLSDSDVEEMLLIKSTGGRPEELIRKKIADFRMSL